MMPETDEIRDTHTVIKGDTLWAIAENRYGAGSLWPVIYEANQEQIQAAAVTAGLWDPEDPGHWIFPNQIFVIPPK